MNLELNGKTALVTGAGSGIGQATALAFAREGAHVVLTDLKQDGLDHTAQLIRDANPDVRTSPSSPMPDRPTTTSRPCSRP